MKKSLATIGLAASTLLLIAGCSDDEPSSNRTTTASTASTEPLSRECVPVDQALRDAIGAEITGAVEGPIAPGGPPRWYYSTADGATWISSVLPDGSNRSFTWPLNDEAREASPIDPPTPENSPVFDGVDVDGPQAEASRECAREAG